MAQVDSTEALELTTYVVTRWYRAPELMLADSYQVRARCSQTTHSLLLCSNQFSFADWS
jgi:hypothetical protein